MRAKNHLTVLLAGIVLAGVIGCSASGPTFEPVSLQGREAVVYVYRSGHNYMGSGVVLRIKVDGETTGGLKNNGYVYQIVSPGKHEVKCTTEVTRSIPFEAEPGESYYVEAEVQWGFFIGRPKLTMVPKDQGQLAILGTRLCNRKKHIPPSCTR
jgi:hypothetical protein